MKEEIEQFPDTNKTRRSALVGIGLLSLFSFLKFGFFTKKKEVISCAPPLNSEMVKMLTQDGQLVEVDIANLGALRPKISDKELQQWVKR